MVGRLGGDYFYETMQILKHCHGLHMLIAFFCGLSCSYSLSVSDALSSSYSSISFLISRIMDRRLGIGTLARTLFVAERRKTFGHTEPRSVVTVFRQNQRNL